MASAPRLRGRQVGPARGNRGPACTTAELSRPFYSPSLLLFRRPTFLTVRSPALPCPSLALHWTIHCRPLALPGEEQ
eukprot:366057-Chlamydomonas_euryale.AAC.5